MTAVTTAAGVFASADDAEARSPGEAVPLAERAAALTGRRDAQVLDVLAVAYAAAGRFDDAVATAREAQAKAAPALARDIARRLALFERREAFVDKR